MADSGNYSRIVADNLARLSEIPSQALEKRLPARPEKDGLHFSAFGRPCVIRPDSILLDGRVEDGVLGILVSLYALNVTGEPCVIEPLKGFKELPDSMPYTGAFSARTQQVLVPHVETIDEQADRIEADMGADTRLPGLSGDFSLLLHPLPKIALAYVFYRADEDFPPSVTCLYSANAASHLPTDGLADVGEYTSLRILQLIGR